MKRFTYRVVEDNGGGLTLFVFRGLRAVYSHSGYEANPGQLAQDLDALDSGADPNGWDGCEEDPQAGWDDLHRNFAYGWEIVASGTGGKRQLHKHKMGRAAQIEFNVSDEERDTARAAAALGTARNEKKARAVRENGKKGGRPRLAK